jgi:hypothetical protein
MPKPLLLLFAGLLLLSGCARNYVIVRTDFSKLYVNNKPIYKDGYYYYKDAQGQPMRLSAGRVREVSPAHMVSDPNAGFKPVHSD